MKLNRVIIVFKNPGRVERENTRFEGSPDFPVEHKKTIDAVRRAVEEMGLACDLIERECMHAGLPADLIATVGGDGTFLIASQFAGEIPMLGINSMPGYSIGFFCRADIDNVHDVLKEIASGKLAPKKLQRIEASIDGVPVKNLALNDILFARNSPAEMSRYVIKVGGESEHQRSSGIWISTGAGSSAAILAAGGVQLDAESHELQYRVREPYAAQMKDYKLLGGLINQDEPFEITPLRDAYIFVDGSCIVHPVRKGQVLSARRSKSPIKVFL
ncbi:MAG TPA: NAD(+)/NADH kinase [bacterium]|nr:hypothetical protein [Myxococcales bacterium]OQA58914.1 MAG: putative inorganic polyphosphate/ATP-NAD kinase [bacterium ADurb.Bin270]HPW45318.1 NAD(+)/NADH kinase [bacterium]HQC51227.1 NAD(+)/NADH kinase [bacterium]